MGNNVYLDTAGSDANSGLTPALAKRTFAAAMTTFRAEIATATDHCTLWIAGDAAQTKTYNVSATEYMSDANNHPVAGKRIVIRGHGDGKPVLTARTKVTGWTDVSYGLVRAPVPVGVDVRELWMDNGLPLARSSEGRSNPFYVVYQWETAFKSVLISSALVPATGGDYLGLEMVICQGWSLSRMRVFAMGSIGGGLTRVFFSEPNASIEFAKGTFAAPPLPITTDQGMPFPLGPYHNDIGQRFWWENRREFLYQEGTFQSHADVDGDIYLRLPAGLANAAQLEAAGGVWAPNGLAEILVLFGAGATQRIKNVDILDIDVQNLGWRDPNSTGFTGYISGADIIATSPSTYGFRQLPAAISATWISSFSLRDCGFRDIAGVGCRIIAPQGLHAEYNTFERVGSSGLVIGWGGASFDNPDANTINRDFQFNDNLFRNVGQVYTGSALFAGAGLRIVVEHNSYIDCGDEGVGVGDGARFLGNPYTDWTVRYNYFENCMTLSSDGACIYINGNSSTRRVAAPTMQPAHTGCRVYGNRFQSITNAGLDPIGGHSACVYLDLGQQGTNVYRNEAKDVTGPLASFGIENCSPHNTWMENRLSNVDQGFHIAYSGFQVYNPETATFLLVQPPLNNPPTVLDNQKYYGVSAQDPAAFYKWVYSPTMTVPEAVIGTDGLYRSTSSFINNGTNVAVETMIAGVRQRVHSRVVFSGA
jgi:hypothetical protein